MFGPCVHKMGSVDSTDVLNGVFKGHVFLKSRGVCAQCGSLFQMTQDLYGPVAHAIHSLRQENVLLKMKLGRVSKTKKRR